MSESVLTSPQSASTPDCYFLDDDRATKLLNGFAQLYRDKRYVDVTLLVAGKEFPCHKNILAASSPFFSAMFSSSMSESRASEVRIEEMDPVTMALVLDYVYSGRVRLDDNTVQNLLSAANLFQLLALRDGSADYMTRRVALANCIGMHFFARAHQCEGLAEKARELINAKFSAIEKEPEFLHLPVDKLIEIIKDDRLAVLKEESVYEACIAWLRYDIENRCQHLEKVMSHVRFAVMSSYYFCDVVEIDPLLVESSDLKLKAYLKGVRYYHMLKNRQAEVELNFTPRKGMTCERGVVVIANPYTDDATKKFNSMELLLPTVGEIRHVGKLPLSVYMPGVCTTGDTYIYMAGGALRKANHRGPFTPEGVSSNIFRYDKGFGTWQVKGKMQLGRSHFPLVTVDEHLYAVGGYNEKKILDSVERYDARLHLCSYVSPLPIPLRCATGVSYRGKLYVFGGETETSMSTAAFRYDPATNAWDDLPNMMTPRALAGSVVYKDRIFVIGGNSQISNKWRKEFLPEHCVSSVEIYDPSTNQWSPGPELPNALCGAGVVKYDGTIMVIGGEDDKSWMAGLFSLREVPGGEAGDSSCSLEWVEGRELPAVMSSFGCVVTSMPKDYLGEKDGQ